MAEQKTEGTYEWEQDVNEQFTDLMEKRGDTVPDMTVLLAEAARIDLELKSDPKDRKQSVAQVSDDTDELEAQIQALSKNSVSKVKGKGKGKEKNKPRFDDTSIPGPTDESIYQESFTSQQETAEIRDELAHLSSRLTNLEATLEGLIGERQNLPNHLDRISQDMNKQFTLMNERLNASIESGIPAGSAQQAVEDVTRIASGTSHVIDAVRGELQEEPQKSSQISQPRPITGQKKKFKLIK